MKEYVEVTFEMEYGDNTRNVLVLLGFVLLFRLLGLLAMRYVNHQTR
ncbi:hypothetical protein SDRG_04859 [Saprolegnia diclina VS20]|uniref:CDR ABC transporter domain-containing protein n=1 Tax=Saprolegnia diclina (strain VS20) TaxID=1156394 RepID=T0QSZ6_SAPDV|nr:hypothetical protein SDRG_04859 [Saprolegnia diclina VS20]EQC37836.1 hypothetical protein SDRG_04859 [Saprolegnia diclina VS20]|eukprot:XP_008608769.1 hypothetical protein SDRG_04859 [Saprolegnia diclina VS20]